MGGWRKPPPELVARFHDAVAGIDALEVRKMFGMPAAFIAGNMTACLFQDTFVVRLPAPERDERLREGWRPFMPTPGRVMREYVALPEDVAADPDAARRWIEAAADYVRTLPPREPKARRARPERTG